MKVSPLFFDKITMLQDEIFKNTGKKIPKIKITRILGENLKSDIFKDMWRPPKTWDIFK